MEAEAQTGQPARLLWLWWCLEQYNKIWPGWSGLAAESNDMWVCGSGTYFLPSLLADTARDARAIHSPKVTVVDSI